MEPISRILEKVIKQRFKSGDEADLYAQALKDPDVQQFLVDHPKLSQPALKASLSNLYEFYQQKVDQANGRSLIQGYAPHLFMNGNVIDVSYAPTKAKQIQDEEKRVEDRVQLIALPERLRKASFQNIAVQDGDGRFDAIGAAASFAQKAPLKMQRGFYLSGDFGVGKTYILAAMANRLAEKGLHVVFLHVPTFIAGLSAHIQAGTLPQVIENIEKADVLIFDDIGAETLSQWSRDDVLGVLLQQRMDNEKPTFFSSNVAMSQLQAHFEETKNATDPVKAARLMERIRFLAREIMVQGPNRRKKSALGLDSR